MVLIQQQRTPQAEAMVARLGDLLRLTLDDVEAQEVPLCRELEFLRLYLSIEQVRFEDRLRVRIAADPDLSDAKPCDVEDLGGRRARSSSAGRTSRIAACLNPDMAFPHRPVRGRISRQRSIKERPRC